MNKEEIIEEYVEYIRNISEADDEKIRSAVNKLIDEDSESLDIIEKFLSKMKIMSIDVKAEVEDDEDTDRKRKERADLLAIFDDHDYAYPLEDLIHRLKKSGYSNPGEIIVEAIQDNFIYADSIDNDGTIYFALKDLHEDL